MRFHSPNDVVDVIQLELLPLFLGSHTAFYCKQQKAGYGLGMRLLLHFFYLSIVICARAVNDSNHV